MLEGGVLGDEIGRQEREEVPFRIVHGTARRWSPSYSSRRPAEEHAERAVLEKPWFQPGCLLVRR